MSAVEVRRDGALAHLNHTIKLSCSRDVQDDRLHNWDRNHMFGTLLLIIKKDVLGQHQLLLLWFSGVDISAAPSAIQAIVAYTWSLTCNGTSPSEDESCFLFCFLAHRAHKRALLPTQSGVCLVVLTTFLNCLLQTNSFSKIDFFMLKFHLGAHVTFYSGLCADGMWSTDSDVGTEK